MLFGRHDRIYAAPDPAGFIFPATSHALKERSLQWARSGHPFVACRSPAPRPNGLINVAVRFPRQSKPGLALAIKPSAMKRRCLPLLLSEAIAAAPAHREFLQNLVVGAARNMIVLHVYGSLFWQAVTAESYMTADSDIDLLFRPETEAKLDAALHFLSAAAQSSPVRLDGEVIFPGQAGVSWRELATGRPEVLVKTLNSVALMTQRDLRCLFQRAS